MHHHPTAPTSASGTPVALAVADMVAEQVVVRLGVQLMDVEGEGELVLVMVLVRLPAKWTTTCQWLKIKRCHGNITVYYSGVQRKIGMYGSQCSSVASHWDHRPGYRREKAIVLADP